ncbi:hypothetical protein [Crateriforma conspicua]|uniref:hypothetical protein n=1 Tax=Crateriforma conspicua TaxID=2527996 RepID=UPI0011A04E4F|nr:hypothetical protein [Crateriforma conspicua]
MSSLGNLFALRERQMNGNEETGKRRQSRTDDPQKKARQVNHQAGFANRFELRFQPRRTIPASPSNDESVVDDVDVVVKVVIGFPELTDRSRDT